VYFENVWMFILLNFAQKRLEVVMLKSSKKLVALMMALVIMVSTAACSSDKSWALKNDSLTAPIGTYIFYLYNAYQEAETAKPDASKPVLGQKIDGKDAEAYIKEKALNYTKMLFVVNDKMKELGLTLTAEETKTIASTTETQWQQASATLEKYGVSKNSFNMVSSDYIMKDQKIFAALYGKGGKKAVSDADLASYFEKNFTDFNFIYAPMYSKDASGNAVAFTDAQKAALKKEFDGYQSDVAAGKKTMQQAADAFKASSKQTTEQLQSATTNLDSNTSLPAELVTLLKSMKNGEVKSAEISGTYLIAMKNDVTKKTSSELGTESTRNSLLAQVKGSEYSKDMEKLAAAYTNVTVNQKAIDSYKPSMFVTPASSTASTPESKAPTAASSAAASK
jgi:hypothetical protein